jgi:GNAT superfamily N-acetyltransferase
MSAVIRPAVVDDLPALLRLVRELAEYERLAHAVVATEESFKTALFGDQATAEALVALLDGEMIGYAIYFENFSTFMGRAGIYLEDLYVRPERRGSGIGKQLLAQVAQVAVERQCQRLEWAVLDWNAPSIEFYKSLGAQPLDEWTIFRMDPPAIKRLAGSSAAGGDQRACD